MKAICYVCSKESTDWRRNFIEIKSQYTQTTISQFIRNFLGDFASLRNIDNESNCICTECLRQIDCYDLICQQVLEQETKLRELLWTTETKYMDMKEEPIDANEPNVLNCSTECDPIAIETEPNIKIIELNSSIKTTPSSKTVMVRQGGKLVRMRLVKCSTTSKSIDPSTFENLPIGSVIKTKDGKIHQLKPVIKTKGNAVSTTTTTGATLVSPKIDVTPLKSQPIGIKRTCDVCGESFVNKMKFFVSKLVQV